MQEYILYEEEKDVWITCLIGGSVNDLKTYLRTKHKGRLPAMYSWDRRFHFGKDGGTTNGYSFHVNAPLGDGEVFYMWVAEPTPYLMGHEITHVVGDILFNRGFEYCYGAEESWAYLNGWVHGKIKKLIDGRISDGIQREPTQPGSQGSEQTTEVDTKGS